MIRTRERQQFRSANPSRRGRPMQPYPPNMLNLPAFVEWMAAEVERADAASVNVPKMVKDSAKLPSSEAIAFRAMKAHGMHLRVRSAEQDKNTYDSTVAATFLRPSGRPENEVNLTMIPVEYIGWIEEILELNYGGHCTIILLCSWMKARVGDPHATVKRDDYGFTLAKVPSGESPIGLESFAFPINVQQVFFSDEEGDPDWKVVLQVDVCSRRSPLEFAMDGSDILSIGHDNDFDGLSREYESSGVVLGEVPDPTSVYLLEMS
jgi:hypothetical protein